MYELLPIIRRKRRPLILENEAAPDVPTVPVELPPERTSQRDVPTKVSENAEDASSTDSP